MGLPDLPQVSSFQRLLEFVKGTDTNIIVFFHIYQLLAGFRIGDLYIKRQSVMNLHRMKKKIVGIAGIQAKPGKNGFDPLFKTGIGSCSNKSIFGPISPPTVSIYVPFMSSTACSISLYIQVSLDV
jgi:hypothetical protein